MLNYKINLKHVTNIETLKDTNYTNWNKSLAFPQVLKCHSVLVT